MNCRHCQWRRISLASATMIAKRFGLLTILFLSVAATASAEQAQQVSQYGKNVVAADKSRIEPLSTEGKTDQNNHMKTIVPKLIIPLAGNISETNGADVVSVQGPHRFLTIGGITGYQPTSLKTIFHIATDLHLKNEGSIALWVAPLETLAVAGQSLHFMSQDPNAQD